MLWAFDAFVWAIGAGGDWHRQVHETTLVRRVQP